MRDIYIVGSGPEWQKCPFDRETWIVGKMLMLKEPPKRADTIFSMDDLNYLLTIRRGMFTKDQFIEKINERSVPYYSSVVTPEIRMAREYPLKEVMSVVRVPYLSKTICYMLAYAIFQKVRSISMFGIAQMGAHEYIQEKGATEFWIGMALGMGIEVNICTPSHLLKSTSEYPYGYVNTFDELRAQGKL